MLLINLHLLKDRQQEVRPLLVASRYTGDYCMPLEVQYMCYIPLISLLYGLFNYIKYVKVAWTDIIRADSKFENW